MGGVSRLKKLGQGFNAKRKMINQNNLHTAILEQLLLLNQLFVCDELCEY